MLANLVTHTYLLKVIWSGPHSQLYIRAVMSLAGNGLQLRKCSHEITLRRTANPERHLQRFS